MEQAQYCICHSPIGVEGTGAQKDGYHLRKFKDIIMGPAGQAYRRTYDAVKCRNGMIHHFIVPGGLKEGQSIQVIPLQDDSNNWPSLTYEITGTIDGAHVSALPTPITGVAVTTTPGNIHSLVLPIGAYHVKITCASNNGYYALITSR